MIVFQADTNGILVCTFQTHHYFHLLTAFNHNMRQLHHIRETFDLCTLDVEASADLFQTIVEKWKRTFQLVLTIMY